MKWTFFILTLVVALLSHSLAAPFDKPLADKDDPELTAGYFEGDMVMDGEQRNVLKNENLRWPNKVVPYIITKEHFTPAHINHILEGMRILESVTCIRFREASPTESIYVNVTGMDGGCYSNVGYLKRKQGVNFEMYPIDTGCFRLGTIVHEFMHTLGIYHQQSASNRDEYVRIVKENIQLGKANNFNKYTEEQVDDFDQEYDYGSVMHYPAYAFSKNGEMTIVPLQEGITAEIMGQRRQMSQSDINKINAMYRCPVLV